MMSMITFYVFLAAESDIRFASSRLDLAVLDLWIFAFLLKSEKKILSVSDLQLEIGCFSMYFWTRNPKKVLEIPYHAYFLSFYFWTKQFLSKTKNIKT